MSESVEYCPECKHDMDRHYTSVTGRVRCLVTEHGLSSSGVIGIPYTSECDCTDGKSARAEREREIQREEDAFRREMVKRCLSGAGRGDATSSE